MLFESVRRDRRPAPPGRLVWVGELRLHVEERGFGELPVVFLPGYLSSTDAWYGVLERLGPDTRALAVDLPGAGYSDHPLDVPYTAPWFADQLASLLDALCIPRAVVVGHSLGGSIALHLAARHTARVAALALVSPLVYVQPAPPGLRLARVAPALMRAFFRSPVGRMAIPPMLRRASFLNGKVDAHERSQVLLSHLDAPGGWEAATTMGLAALTHAPGPELIRQVFQPCLMFWGQHDRCYAPAESARLQRDLGGPTRLVLLERSAHNGHEEEPARVAEELCRWLAELPNRPQVRAAPRAAAQGGRAP
ncbi:MAG TPA: alpha/beta hydrolase [Myxococcota bacterium]|nr:alpha/beta hydrolase [Myxococcota bacterium]HRY94722.1 alpha/beta hydrolase [Myxococcota bacterium]HSA20055.1 alpha/beta hydrolase [Myxococcota bacterium]